MKHIGLLGFIAAISIISFSVNICDASELDVLPVKVINGKSYHFYDVKAKETIYSLCHRFGVSKEEIVKNNPAVADGLKAGMTLYFPVAAIEEAPAEVTFDNGDKQLIHHVEKGETIYGIARKYGITTEDIFKRNPFVADGLKVDQELTIVIEAPMPEPEVTVSYRGYVVKEKETFYSIAHENGLTVAQLEAANPGISVLKSGQVLNIPVYVTATISGPVAEVAPVEPDTIQIAPIMPEDPVIAGLDDPFPTDTATVTEEPHRDHIDITVMLPFMLTQDPVSKEGRRFTEFYKGFLIAADALRDNGTPIIIRAYDTTGSIDSVKAILAYPELKNTDVIIAPDNFSQLIAIGEFGRENKVNVLNPFVVKDETYIANPAMMQANLPSDIMQTKAVGAISKVLPSHTPVFVSCPGWNDKAEIIADMKKHFIDNGITFREITINDRLTAENLAGLDKNGKYVFVPCSGKQSELNKVLPALIEWQESCADPEQITVFGYPEWITYRGETLSNMQKLNTRVYSRFYSDPMDIETRAVEDTFKKWFGCEMENAVPRQGLMGYDIGMFLIKNLTNEEDLKSPDPYRGVQNGFKFVSPDNTQGMYNDVLYIVTFRPSGYTDRTVL